MKELEIDETFMLKGKKYKCVAGNGCEYCAAYTSDEVHCFDFPECMFFDRQDDTEVIFVEVKDAEDSKETKEL